jgi:hypothetical protein
VLTLNAGSYGNQTVTGTKAAPGVTFRAAAGAIVTLTDLDVKASNVTFDGLDADGTYSNRFRVNGGTSFGAGANNVTVRGLHLYSATTITWGNVVFLTNATNVTIERGEVGPAKSSDGIDIWPGNNGVTIRGNHIHHITEVDASDHPDAIQSYSAGTSRNPGLKIIGNVFDNNVNSNVHCDSETVGTLIENNIVFDTTATSGIPAYTSIRCMGAKTVYSYNTFPGNQPIQTPSNGYPQDQQYIGNVGASVQNCTGSLFSKNVWTGNTCGTTDKKVADRGLTADGHLTAGSPANGAGDPSRFPLVDFDGQFRASPPDAGADDR